MTRRKTLTDAMVVRMRPGPKRITKPDPELRGHYVRVTPQGAKSYCAVTRGPAGKQVWATIGPTDRYSIDEARDQAREAIKRIKAGMTPFEPPPTPPDSFKAVAENYLTRHVTANALRTGPEIERILNKYIYPAWQAREFAGIRRSDVAALLDTVQDNHGARTADYVLSIIRGVMNWYAARSDDYVPPLARGMGRADPKSRKRARILDDDELRRVWTTASGSYGAIVRLAILTAQRREKIGEMRWADVTVDGVWTIPTEDREKGAGGELVLPDIALDIIKSQQRVGDSPYVFPARRATAISVAGAGTSARWTRRRA